MVALQQEGGGIALSIELIRDVWPKAVLAENEERTASIRRRDARMNRDDEIDAFVRIVSRKDQDTKVLVIEGPSGMGKSQLLIEYEEIAKRYGLFTESKTLKEQITIDAFLLSIGKHFGGRPKFQGFFGYREQPRGPSEQEHSRLLAQKFCADLYELGSLNLLLLLIDDFEKGDKPLREWLSEHFLPEIATELPLIAVVAGQTEPDLPYGEKWVKKFSLQRVTLECFSSHLQHQGVRVSPDIVRRLYERAGGVPHNLGLVSYPLMLEALLS